MKRNNSHISSISNYINSRLNIVVNSSKATTKSTDKPTDKSTDKSTNKSTDKSTSGNKSIPNSTQSNEKQTSTSTSTSTTNSDSCLATKQKRKGTSFYIKSAEAIVAEGKPKKEKVKSSDFAHLPLLSEDTPLSENDLKFICKTEYLYSLYKLNLSKLNMEGLTFTFDSYRLCSNLSYLDLSYNILESIPAIIKEMYNLEFIKISDNKLNDISSIENLYNLKSLILNNNKIDNKSLKSFIMLNELTTLVISNNKFTKLPNFSNNLKLSKLSISHNEITEISNDINNNTMISELRLNGNKISKLITLDLPDLKLLDLGNNKIVKIEEIKKLTSLEVLENLNIKGNDVDQLKSAKLFPKLTCLNYGKDKITKTLDNPISEDILVKEVIRPMKLTSTIVKLKVDTPLESKPAIMVPEVNLFAEKINKSDFMTQMFGNDLIDDDDAPTMEISNSNVQPQEEVINQLSKKELKQLAKRKAFTGIAPVALNNRLKLDSSDDETEPIKAEIKVAEVIKRKPTPNMKEAINVIPTRVSGVEKIITKKAKLSNKVESQFSAETLKVVASFGNGDGWD